MRGPPGDSVEAFEELRRLLLSGEREQLRDLRDRLTTGTPVEGYSRGVAEAVKLTRERGEELVQALRPAVEGSIKQSIEKRAGHLRWCAPIQLLDRWCAINWRNSASPDAVAQSDARTPFLLRGLKMALRSLAHGKSFAEVRECWRSLVYRVEQLFLIHRKTSLSLLHVALDPAIAKDSDMVAGMLSAIQDFARDSFATGDDSALEEFRVGELQVWIAPGQYAYLAAVIRGLPRANCARSWKIRSIVFMS
jgi:OOP family OmpA-OmpF porin